MAPSTQWNSMRTSADLRQILEGICLGGYYKRCKPGSKVLYLGYSLRVQPMVTGSIWWQ